MRVTHNDLRAALELEVKRAVTASGGAVSRQVLEVWLGHSEKVSKEHYKAEALDTLTSLVHRLVRQ